ncbi:sugar isomerase domain-containing protein [Demequina sp. NBRC 110057]|uniref:sugar isomerase domain-containing protein n=1 Tax=Demequina sp. NBRC 110057 TaxID=1570346 RepID=UPI000A029E97|nr:sugar isomerase domain-containing protein [Demequina sp. NBRC 110057]
MDASDPAVTDSLPLAGAGARYLATTVAILEDAIREESVRMAAAAEAIAAALVTGRTLHTFGSGHSNLLSEELFYRAGGLKSVRPLFFEGLMLHGSNRLATRLERIEGLAAHLLDDHGVSEGDVLIVSSNSGGNAVSVEAVQEARERGLITIAVTSIAHATSPDARPTPHPKLHEVADIVLDNHGAVGDAAVAVEAAGTRLGPTSTVVGAALLNAVMAEAIERAAIRGWEPDLWVSSGLAIGDAANG